MFRVPKCLWPLKVRKIKIQKLESFFLQIFAIGCKKTNRKNMLKNKRPSKKKAEENPTGK